MPSTFRISMSIINFRKLDILFATESLKHIVEKKIKNRIFYNFSLNEISSFDDKKTNTFHDRQYDFCLYFRKHPNKNELFFKKFIDDFKVNFPGRKLIIFGDDPEVEENDNIKFLGTVDNKIILNYLNQTKFSIVSDETLFSFFMLDCLSKNVAVFYNKKNYTFDQRLINLVAKVHQINFNNFEESLSKINEILNTTQEIPNYKFENFKDYYADYFLKF